MKIRHTIADTNGLRAALLLISCLFILFLSSCNQESYESGDGKYSYMKAEFVDAYTNGDAKLVNVMTDDGDSLALSKPVECKWATKADSTYRALLYYNKVEGKAEPVSFSNVPTPNIRMTSELKEEVKTDPVKFVSSWKSRNRRYLNLGITLLTGAAKEELNHKIGMLCDSVVTTAEGRQQVYLRLYHDQGGIPEYYSMEGYVSIKVSRLPCKLNDGDIVHVAINTYDGWITRQFEY